MGLSYFSVLTQNYTTFHYFSSCFYPLLDIVLHLRLTGVPSPALPNDFAFSSGVECVQQKETQFQVVIPTVQHTGALSHGAQRVRT